MCVFYLAFFWGEGGDSFFRNCVNYCHEDTIRNGGTWVHMGAYACVTDAYGYTCMHTDAYEYMRMHDGCRHLLICIHIYTCVFINTSIESRDVPKKTN